MISTLAIQETRGYLLLLFTIILNADQMMIKWHVKNFYDARKV